MKIDIKRGTVAVNNPDQSKGVPPKTFTFGAYSTWAVSLDISRGCGAVVFVREIEWKGSVAFNPCYVGVHHLFLRCCKPCTDMAFDWDSKQLDVYNATARDIVDSVTEGYNGTVFASVSVI